MSLIPFELYHSARVRIAKSCYVLMVLGSFLNFFFEILGEVFGHGFIFTFSLFLPIPSLLDISRWMMNDYRTQVL